MTCIILQSRLDSSRLPQKAMLDLAGKPIIVRVMENLKQIPADKYVLACDTASEAVFAPLASSCGFICISGPKENVLERFCIVIRSTGASTVLRATGDNPFLFADAAEESLRRFKELQSDSADYFTLTGLPHGSGIEVFSAKSLLEAASLAESSYEREHVGPSLYNHGDRFNCVRETAGTEWYHPEIRTTIDTPDDYKNACLMAEYIYAKGLSLPASTETIIEAFFYANRPLLFVPSVTKGQGTGHLRRLAGIIGKLQSRWRCLLYIPPEIPVGSNSASFIPEQMESLIIHELPNSAHLVILDHFRTTSAEMQAFRKIGPIVALDEGGKGRTDADYLIDIIPGIPRSLCPPNRMSPSFLPLPLPEHRKTEAVKTIRTVLVLAGGENAARLAMSAARILSELELEVTVIDPDFAGIASTKRNPAVSGPVPDLGEKLYKYDLVVTHFGFTAFEALAAGCSVILFSPTEYHYQLGRANGFSVFPPGVLSSSGFSRILDRGVSVPPAVNPSTVQTGLEQMIVSLASRSVRSCPFCGNRSPSGIIARFPDRTVKVCPECGMSFLSFLIAGEQKYSRSYFFDEYQAQYGKTYLEDFEAIRKSGSRRLSVIEKILSRKFKYLEKKDKKLLDIGCAYGPFLAEAKDARWDACGTDISEDAVNYVRDNLHIPAVVSSFPAPDGENFFEKHGFLAITLWYVIEHFEDLEPVMQRIRDLLIPGGILAFSTPSTSGVSGIFNRESFFRNSPRDHFTLWSPHKVSAQLARYGFSVIRIISTGHHGERFPFMKGRRQGSPALWLCTVISKIFRLGDTFEVYAVKKGTLEDVE